MSLFANEMWMWFMHVAFVTVCISTYQNRILPTAPLIIHTIIEHTIIDLGNNPSN